MSTSQAASLNVVPLLARIVLAAAFIPAGWNKLMSETTFEGEDAALLRSIGAVGSGSGGAASPAGGAPGRSDDEAAPKTSAPNTSAPNTSALFGPGATGGWSMLAATPPGGPATAPPPPPGSTPPAAAPPATPPAEKAPGKPAPSGPSGAQPSGGPPPGSASNPASPPSPGQAPPSTPSPTSSGDGRPADASSTASTASAPLGDPSPLKAASLHHVTLMVHRQGMAYPVYQAYLATAVELLGGSLILLGLFSRLWGLGLAGVMAVAFWLTSWPLLAAGHPFGVLFSLPIADFNRVFCQAGLFVLAFGVFLTGPGALSLDRAIFRKAPVE